MGIMRGDHIRIKEMADMPHYAGREGDVEFIDDMGWIHGTWGPCALIPETDQFSVTSVSFLRKRRPKDRPSQTHPEGEESTASSRTVQEGPTRH